MSRFLHKDALVELLFANPVVPIVTVTDRVIAHRQIDAVVEGGAGVVEILLRNPLAPQAIADTIQRHPDLVVAAGSVIGGDRYRIAEESGAHFAVSPGLSADLVGYAEMSAVPLVPGAITPSEVMAARTAGFRLLKFYPSEPISGRDILSDYRFLFPDLSFLATAGIMDENLPAYGALRNVASVGGAWMFDLDSELRTAGNMARAMKLFRSGRP